MTVKHHNQPYTLGLDIGIASVGAALLTDNQILALHVRAFDKAEVAKTGESLNKIRRDSRSARRRLRRKAFRLTRLRRLFVRQGLTTSFDPVYCPNVSPWELRSQGLDRPLNSAEWAAVIYHIIKHRGFQSTRKSEATEDEKTGKMLSGVAENQKLLQSGEYRTIGEVIAKHPNYATAKRNKSNDYSHTVGRDNLIHEIEQLFQAQRQYANPHADAAFEQQVIKLLLARRPALSGDQLLEMVGKCTFEKEQYRAPKACHSAERFIWLTKLSNTRIHCHTGTRKLTDSERELLIDYPFFGTKTRLSYQQARKILKLSDDETFVGVTSQKGSDLEKAKDPEAKIFFEAKHFHQLRKVYLKADLQKAWEKDCIDRNKLDNIGYALSVFKEDNASREWMLEQQIEPEIIEAVLELSFSTFINLSLKALNKILPNMQHGYSYDEAIAITPEYRHHSQLNKDTVKSHYLPKFNKDDIRNPVVYRSLNQARKLVNAIVKHYGSPAAVHIELARDLSKSYEERRDIQKEQNNYQQIKQKDIEAFEQLHNFTPKGLDLLKWRLYREQDSKCAYSLKPLELERLFEHGYCQVDHALPYSRSYDNSMNNKVLVHTKENQDKGNKTPYEYLDGASNSTRWRAFQANITSNKKIRIAKKNKLLLQEFGTEQAEKFRDRNLNDTRYACRYFKNHVETHLQLANDNNSVPVTINGQLTAFLRARWGLLKVRSDGDLHHALDAAVVAACNRSMVKRLSDYSRKNELAAVKQNYTDPETGEISNIQALRRAENSFPEPWEGFRQELINKLTSDHKTLQDYPGYEPVRVSRAPKRRNLGAAHEATIRSAKGLEQEISWVKTPLESLKLDKLHLIMGYEDPRNKTMIEAIQQRLEDFKGNGKAAFKEPLYKPSKAGKGPIIRTVKVQQTQKSGKLVRNGIAENGDMHRVDIFEKQGKHYAVPIYIADFASAVLPNKAAVARQSEANWPEMDDSYRFLFSLHSNDWLRVTLKKEIKEGYFAGFDRATASVNLWAHDRNPTVGKDGLIESIGIKTALKLEKFEVDMLGKLYPSQALPRQPLKKHNPNTPRQRKTNQTTTQ
jgi:CRISPR-associated endonuclease Csn1